MLLTHHARDLQIAAHAEVLQDLRDLQVDLRGTAQPGAGSHKTVPDLADGLAHYLQHKQMTELP